jgi:ribokinase
MSRVHVLGNAGMDYGLRLPHMPAPGETVVGHSPHRAPGGKGLNQAVAAVRCGAAVRFLAPLGDDPDADVIAGILGAEPFEALNLPRIPGLSDRSTLLLMPDGENCIVSTGACAEAFTVGDAERFARAVAPGEILLMQGNLSRDATMAAASACAGRIMLNTAPVLWDVRPMLADCDIVVANAVEAQAIAGSGSAASIRDAGVALAIVTLGAGGCLVADAGGERHMAACKAEPVDSTGAGDAFCGTLAGLLALAWPTAEAIAAAQRIAAKSVECRGAFAALPTALETSHLLSL